MKYNGSPNAELEKRCNQLAGFKAREGKFHIEALKIAAEDVG